MRSIVRGTFRGTTLGVRVFILEVACFGVSECAMTSARAVSRLGTSRDGGGAKGVGVWVATKP